MRPARVLKILAAFLAASLFAGCKSDPPSPPAPPPEVAVPSCDSGTATLDTVTWNVALGPGMNPLRRPRAPHVAKALGDTQFDVLCLQELWTDHDRDLVVRELKLPPENLLLPETVGKGETGRDTCSVSQVESVASCARQKCAGLDDDDVSTCVKDKCVTALAPIAIFDRKCLNCLIATAGRNAGDVKRICSTTGASRIHEGRTGLLLASRWPLQNRETLLVPATSANRAGLFATVQVPGMAEPVEIACTHLTASSKDISPDHSGLESWHLEKLTQLNLMSARLAERAGGRPQLLMGDYNIAPVPGTNRASSAEDLWQRVLDLGFAPTPLAFCPKCTSCGDNTFRLGGSERVNDHSLARDPDGGMRLQSCSAQRLYDEPIVVRTRHGQEIVTHLSDHYGVRTVFTAR